MNRILQAIDHGSRYEQKSRGIRLTKQTPTVGFSGLSCFWKNPVHIVSEKEKKNEPLNKKKRYNRVIIENEFSCL